MTPVGLSLVICTRNRARQLETCLEHVSRVSSDTVWELVVVDNGSTDGTRAVLERFRQSSIPNFRIVEEPIPGLGRARNRGWKAASGAIVAFTDDDCHPAADYVDRMVGCFGDPAIGFIGGRVRLGDPADFPIATKDLDRRFEIEPKSFIRAGLLAGANMAFRKTVLGRISGFDDAFGAGTPFACEDVDAVARASAAGWRGAYDPGPVVDHHHGRDKAEAARLMRAYDWGRGAYYVKCLANPELRFTYAGAWALRVLTQTPARTAREVRGALAYLRTPTRS